MRKLTMIELLERCHKIHGDEYDYSKVQYKNIDEKVLITCKKCGKEFWQSMNKHINQKQGCPYCANNIKLTKEEFIKKAKEIYGDKYDYSEAQYKNIKTKIKIFCKECQQFFYQSPELFLRKGRGGCNLNYRLTTEKFIERAKQIHRNKYDYSLVNYINCDTKIKIICHIHGIFEQIPDNHLHGNGCPKCITYKGEEAVKSFLKENNIKFEFQKSFPDLKDKKFLKFDFYLPDKNLLIEYNGRQHYEIVDYFGGYQRFLIQKHHDWLKRKYARDNGYNFLTISYKDDIINILKEIINV